MGKHSTDYLLEPTIDILTACLAYKLEKLQNCILLGFFITDGVARILSTIFLPPNAATWRIRRRSRDSQHASAELHRDMGPLKEALPTELQRRGHLHSRILGILWHDLSVKCWCAKKLEASHERSRWNGVINIVLLLWQWTWRKKRKKKDYYFLRNHFSPWEKNLQILSWLKIVAFCWGTTE